MLFEQSVLKFPFDVLKLNFVGFVKTNGAVFQVGLETKGSFYRKSFSPMRKSGLHPWTRVCNHASNA
jgi:hypothetical protein